MAAKFGFSRLAGVEKAGSLHLELHESQGPVVQDDNLHGQLVLNQRHEVAHHHREAAIS
jgi:hypothetical protein